MTTRQSKRRLLAAVPLSVLLMLAAACGDDDDDTATGSEGSGEGDGGGGGGGMTVEIVSPDDGAEIGDPIELELDSSEDIGETDTGLHHLHVHYDGDDENYDIVYEEGTHTPGQDLEPGEHTVQLVLANADHSETDVTDEITIMVGEGSGGGGSGGDDTTTTVDPYGIDY